MLAGRPVFSVIAAGVFSSVAIAQFALPTAQPAPATQAAPATQSPAPTVSPAAVPPTTADNNQPRTADAAKVASICAEAKLAISQGNLAAAQAMLATAEALQVPDAAFTAEQLRPWQVRLELTRMQESRGVSPAVAGSPSPGASNAVYQPSRDASSVAQATALQLETAAAGGVDLEAASGQALYELGMQALIKQDRDGAMRYFSAAWKKQAELDPAVRAQLKDKMTSLSATAAATSAAMQPMPPSVSAEAQQQALLRQKMFREVTGEIAEAERMVNDQPLAAMDRLQMLRTRVAASDLDGETRKVHLAMVDRVIANVDAYITENKAAIDQQQRNDQVISDMDAEAAHRARVDAEIQRAIDEYNALVGTEQFLEAELVAKRVAQLDPNSEISSVMLSKARIARRDYDNRQIKAAKEEGFLNQLASVDAAAVGIDDNNPYILPEDWADVTRRRRGGEDISMLPAERRIRDALNEAVSVSFDARPLASAVDTISKMTGIPMLIDPQGLVAEGITADQPVSLELNGNEISLRSALVHLLEPLNLTYVVQNEVLKITSRNTIVRPREAKVYPVGDLVIPIPNATLSPNSDFSAALQSAHQNQNNQLLVSRTTATPLQMASAAGVAPNSPALGQMAMPGGLSTGSPMPGSMGGMMPGGMMGGNGFGMPGMGTPGMGAGGGNALADFQPLIDLITQTVDGEWDLGENTISQFASNLSLIVNAPLEVHEQIAALLKQLRDLQNLQVTVEIRFISLSEQFVERMGVDFDFNIDDNATGRPGLTQDDRGRSTSIGLSQGVNGFGAIPTILPSVATGDFDLQFRQNSFGASTPPFGTFAPDFGAQLGVAILSDIELFFFLNAAQGDSRTQVMQAPKVTMFDGQMATVSDFASVPFVVGLTPVVGDFAVAQAPVVVLLNEGTQMGVQSVISNDKRFVRMTLSPAFTTITDRERTFTFTGTRSSNNGVTVIDDNGDPLPDNENVQQTFTGSTVQLPTLGLTSVSTTVNVPDGGTVLLGGIKRLSEGRTERGVPMLSKIPYLNRLFSNVATGRETRTFMMTVTPRIIIPAEEEAAVLGTTP